MSQVDLPSLEMSSWLANIIETANCNEENTEGLAQHIQLPLTTDGKNYSPERCTKDQRQIIATVLSYVKKWTEYQHENIESTVSYKPLRMTICGQAGSGKSVLIHTLVTILRTIFQNTDAAIVVGPTGSSAFNAGGKTMHSFFGIHGKEGCNQQIPSTTQATLLRKLSKCIAVIIDERSMVSSNVLAIAENACSKTMFKGRYSEVAKISWGGVPILLLVGDDYQLPPIESGAFDIFDSNRKFTSSQLRGQELFKEAGKNVMFLRSVKRALPTQQRLQQILHGVRGEPCSNLTEDDLSFICKFHLSQEHYSDADRQQIGDNAMHLFANKDKMREFNRRKLILLHNIKNPVAKIKARNAKMNGSISQTNLHYDENRTPSSVCLCIGCQVELTGKNLNPEWGLFNGSMGTVIDIVFDKEKSPNKGDLPLYVLVDFPLYCGPALTKLHKTLVPITPVISFCQKYRNCCKREFLPLKLAFGKTIHTFQGASVGPVAEGQPPNSIKAVICDPGTRAFEGNNPGLFYTLLSRVTTLGTEEDKFSSAIYFTGENMNKSRIRNITTKENGEPYMKVVRRQKWVNFLNSNIHEGIADQSKQQGIFRWANDARFGINEMESIISKVQRSHMIHSNKK